MKPAVLESGRIRYVVEEFLTEGGMGAIYLGRRDDGARQDEVILKALLPELTAEPTLVELFLREARLTASLAHPHIVRTLDLVAGQGTYFIVMEYVVGADLRTLERRARRRGKQLAPPLALHVHLAMLEALDYAHRRLTPDGRPLGLIHRDISPSNILVGGDGRAKLSDFGIAKLSTHRSTFHRVKGKLGYMAPEQARGEPVDVRTDLFALAICLHEGLAGERLYPHAAASPTVAAIYAHRPPRPSELRPELPRELDRVLDKALALDPAARFQSAAEMRAALIAVADRHGLLWSDAEAAAHLRDACGDDPRAWLRIDPTANPTANPAAPQQHTEAYASDEPLDPFAEDEGELPRRMPSTRVLDGTQLTSLFDPRGLDRPPALSPPPAPPRSQDDVVTRFAPPGSPLSSTPASLVTPAPPVSGVERWTEEVTAIAFDGDATRLGGAAGASGAVVASSALGARADAGHETRSTRVRPGAEPTVPLDALTRESPLPSAIEPDTAMRQAPPASLGDRLRTLELGGEALWWALGGALLLGLVIGLVLGLLLG